jgi:hemerythrin
MAIRWDDSMATGVAKVDDQHRMLISCLNELLNAMAQGKGRTEIDRVLARLGDYTATHFGYEEQCMTTYRCPVASQNKRAHDDFIATFTAFRRDFDAEGATSALAMRVQRELADWVARHIRGVDVHLRSCVKAA